MTYDINVTAIEVDMTPIVMVIVSGQDDDGNDPTCPCLDYGLHFISFYWKSIFAFIP